MSYRMGVEIKNMDRLLAGFTQAPNTYRLIMGSAVVKAADKISRDAKNNAPRLTSHLAGSISFVGPEHKGAQITARVGTILKYAPYQEYGTGVYAGQGPIRPKSKKVLAWKSGGQWVYARSVKGIRPKKYFKRAFDENQTNVQAIFSTALADFSRSITK